MKILPNVGGDRPQVKQSPAPNSSGKAASWLTFLGFLGLLLSPLSLQAGSPGPGSLRPHPQVLCEKATAPLEVQWTRLGGDGSKGEPLDLLLTATPSFSGGELEVEVVVPEGVRVRSGTTQSSSQNRGQPRLVQIRLELEDSTPRVILAKVRWKLSLETVWTRAKEFVVPLGASLKPLPGAQIQEQPGGGNLALLSSGGPGS